MKNKILIFLLINLLLSVFTVGCSNEPAGNNTETSATDTDSVQSNQTQNSETQMSGGTNTLAGVLKELPERNFEGYEFVIITRDPTSPYWATIDVSSEKMDGEPINDAVYECNSLLEDKYNVKIKEFPSVSGASLMAKTLILAAEDSFTAVTDGLNQLSVNLASNNMLLDYNAIPGIKLDKPWWDQAMNGDLSIMRKLYFVTGDISIMDNAGTWCIYFNKDILNDFSSLESPYTLVENNKWLITKLYEYATAVAADLDGDGVMKFPGDRYGLATEAFNNYAFWVGGGMKIAGKTSDDIPYLTMYSEKSVNVLAQVLAMNLDKNIAFDHNPHSEYLAANGLVNILFRLAGMRNLPVYRKFDIDFGVLPLPKYDEAQEKYYTTYSNNNFTAYSVPVTTKDIERTGVLLEAMAAVSYYTLTPAYYEISLKGKILRDEESGPMIDMILANRAYDIGQVFNWGGALSMFTQITNAGSFNFESKYAALESKTISEMEKFIEEIS